jgi:DNA gyrase subunit B
MKSSWMMMATIISDNDIDESLYQQQQEHVNGGELSSPQSTTTSNNYSASQITVLSGLEPVRKRPGMYIGSTGPDGLHHLIYEVLDNSVDEALAGHAKLINVILHDHHPHVNDNGNGDSSGNCCTVIDDGRGIPTDLHPQTQISALETVLTVLHAGGKFDNANSASGYKVSGGLHGVGISVVNALSEFVEVRVDREKSKRKMMRFERGVPVGQLIDEDHVNNHDEWKGVVYQTNDIKAKILLGDDDNFDYDIVNDGDDEDEDDGGGKIKVKAKTATTSKKAGGSKASTSTIKKGMMDDSQTLEYKTSLVQSLLSNRKSGTTVTFLPDISVFKGANGKPGITFDETKLALRMDEIAYLNAGLVLTLQDKRSSSMKRGVDRSNVVTIFHHAGGLSEYADFLCRGKTPMFGDGSSTTKSKAGGTISKVNDSSPREVGLSLSADGTTLLFHAEITPTGTNVPQTPIAIDAALRYTANSYNENILSFVNNIRTRDGGSHVDGLKSCLTRSLNQAARRFGKLKEGDGNLSGDYVREGLTAIISVSVSEPEFEGQTKGRLGNPEVRPAVEAALGGELNKFFDFHPEILNILFENAARAAAAAAAAKAAREVVRKKTLLQSTVLPGKLADCSSKEFSETELFIVEGDSAAGSAKQGRDRRTQAILPLRGKILNIERAAPERIYQNSELQGLISACGLGMKGSELEETSLRYGKIVIMTDADVDGAHIRVLLLTFFFRYQRELVEKGYLYIAQPPLYKIMTGSGRSRVEKYTFSDEEKDKYLREMLGIKEGDPIGDNDLSDGKVMIQRFKGLGEMMPKQLWETTMDPESRTLLQVSVNDCALADMTMDILMGDAVGPRRSFIIDRSENMKLGDLDV